jgi:putative ABC transport system substrate-binding protein
MRAAVEADLALRFPSAVRPPVTTSRMPWTTDCLCIAIHHLAKGLHAGSQAQQLEAAWPLAARAQQPDRMRRIGVLMNLAADDPDSQARIGAFLQGLQGHSWTIGSNVRIDYRWNIGDVDRFRRYAAELLALAPDVLLTVGGQALTALQQATRAVPIVFVGVIDPVGAGVVESLARPGGNATGFTLYEFGLSGKWLELLKQIAPRVTRVGVLRDSSTTGGIGHRASILTDPH